uniref:Cytochrome c1-2 heme protein-like isoform X2 n=1 Tax=Rhizophora mucronata TaxID=61149 RepID=A0A2P2K7W3_RHIMU
MVLKWTQLVMKVSGVTTCGIFCLFCLIFKLCRVEICEDTQATWRLPIAVLEVKNCDWKLINGMQGREKGWNCLLEFHGLQWQSFHLC